MRHPYTIGCNCKRCTRECARRTAQANRNVPRGLKRWTIQRKPASREEQHARYIDCGPQTWDDRD